MQKAAENCQMELATALHACAGHKKMSIKGDLAPRTGIPWRRIYKFMDETAEPSWLEVRALIRELGPNFQNMLTEPLGIGGARELTLDYCHFTFADATAHYNYQFTHRIKDGSLCHIDQAELEPIARTITMLAPVYGKRRVRRIEV